VAVIALNVALVGTTLLFTYWQGAFYNALEARDWQGFLASLFWWHTTPQDGFTFGFSPVLVMFVLITAFEQYLRQALQIGWRAWMTRTLTRDWLSDHAYLRMALTDPHTDNPDQRIAEDIRLFVDNALVLGLGVIRATVSVISFVVLLWTLSEPIVLAGVTIPGYPVWIALLYAVAGTWVTHRVGNELTPLHFVQQRTEADFRFSLMRLIENVEGVALHRGEAEQARELSDRFGAIVRTRGYGAISPAMMRGRGGMSCSDVTTKARTARLSSGRASTVGLATDVSTARDPAVIGSTHAMTRVAPTIQRT
jgi:vitamin B12/bleomycin/antimicrobial peptide transport system ATP-binding/permease protein